MCSTLRRSLQRVKDLVSPEQIDDYNLVLRIYASILHESNLVGVVRRYNLPGNRIGALVSRKIAKDLSQRETARRNTNDNSSRQKQPELPSLSHVGRRILPRVPHSLS